MEKQMFQKVNSLKNTCAAKRQTHESSHTLMAFFLNLCEFWALRAHKYLALRFVQTFFIHSFLKYKCLNHKVPRSGEHRKFHTLMAFFLNLCAFGRFALTHIFSTKIFLKFVLNSLF
jgi:hypothetical protein